jgi:hypothetical protein
MMSQTLLVVRIVVDVGHLEKEAVGAEDHRYLTAHKQSSGKHLFEAQEEANEKSAFSEGVLQHRQTAKCPL